MDMFRALDQFVERDVDRASAGGEGDGVAAFAAGKYQRAAFEGFIKALLAGFIAPVAAQQVDRQQPLVG